MARSMLVDWDLDLSPDELEEVLALVAPSWRDTLRACALRDYARSVREGLRALRWAARLRDD